MYMIKSIFIGVFLVCSFSVFSQKMAVKNNFVYDAFKTPNLSLEYSPGRKWTIDARVGMNFFFYENKASSSRYKTRKFSHWLFQPEARYWTCEAFNGWFWGLHFLGGEMNIWGRKVPFVLQKGKSSMKNYRYEGWFLGGGLSVGYQWLLSNRFNLEAAFGIGYVYARYDKYRCVSCGRRMGKGKADYIGPTQASVSIVYLLW